MNQMYVADDPDSWVRRSIIVFLLITLAAVGLVIIDGKISEIVEPAVMPQFRSMLFLSVLCAGVGARAILARNTATVDAQGWVFLILVGLLFLAGAAWGFTDCFYEVRDAHGIADAIKSLRN